MSSPKQLFLIIATVLLTIFVVGIIGGLIYYQGLRSTPQYSLALLVDAAKRDDTNEINELVNIDAVADDFMPQVMSKAVELYGRGLPPPLIKAARCKTAASKSQTGDHRDRRDNLETAASG